MQVVVSHVQPTIAGRGRFPANKRRLTNAGPTSQVFGPALRLGVWLGTPGRSCGGRPGPWQLPAVELCRQTGPSLGWGTYTHVLIPAPSIRRLPSMPRHCLDVPTPVCISRRPGPACQHEPGPGLLDYLATPPRLPLSTLRSTST